MCLIIARDFRVPTTQDKKKTASGHQARFNECPHKKDLRIGLWPIWSLNKSMRPQRGWPHHGLRQAAPAGRHGGNVAGMFSKGCMEVVGTTGMMGVKWVKSGIILIGFHRIPMIHPVYLGFDPAIV